MTDVGSPVEKHLVLLSANIVTFSGTIKINRRARRGRRGHNDY